MTIQNYMKLTELEYQNSKSEKVLIRLAELYMKMMRYRNRYRYRKIVPSKLNTK
jgi:hypothetical protein